MTQLQTAPQPTANVQVIPRQSLIAQNEAIDLMDTAKFEHMWRVAKVIACSSLLPAHLKGQNQQQAEANSFRVVDQAVRWGFNPFAVVDCTYVVSGKLGFEGKLVAAVINARAGLHDGLLVNYNGEQGPKKAAVIYGSTGPIPKEARPLLKKYLDTGDGEAVSSLVNDYGVKAIRITVEQAATKNQMWTSDPEQKLFYTGATKWARRFKPEMLLGVLTEDDLERISSEAPKVPELPTRGGSLIPHANGTHKEPETPPSPPAPKAETTPNDVKPEIPGIDTDPRNAPAEDGEIPNEETTGEMTDEEKAAIADQEAAEAKPEPQESPLTKEQLIPKILVEMNRLGKPKAEGWACQPVGKSKFSQCSEKDLRFIFKTLAAQKPE